MLDVINVTKVYDSVFANDNVSLSVGAGEVALLIGPNGAGKSTLIKSIMALLSFEGEIFINGHSNRTIEAKKNITFIPEIPNLYDLLTVSEHVELTARAFKLNNSWKEESEKLFARFELSDKKDKIGKELSKGMQQKVSIVCALIVKPKVILFDEPMVGLDPYAIKELKNIFIELKGAGTAVLISTHMLDSVEQVWDKANIMMNGKICTTKTREEISATGESLEKIFFEITEVAHPKVN